MKVVLEVFGTYKSKKIKDVAPKIVKIRWISETTRGLEDEFFVFRGGWGWGRKLTELAAKHLGLEDVFLFLREGGKMNVFGKWCCRKKRVERDAF